MILSVAAIFSMACLIKRLEAGEMMESGGGVRLMPVPPWNFSSRERMELSAMVMLGLREWYCP